jgi:very-short-patch-repair endonuclease
MGCEKDTKRPLFIYICDKCFRKTDLRPLLGIELDDWSHDSEERKLRDVNVETIFKEAGFPLVRLRNIHHLSENELLLNINSKLIQ